MNSVPSRLAGLFTYSIIVVAFLDTMAMLPILSPFVLSLGAGALYTGVILGSYSLVNMLGNITAGPIIDIYGRRIPMVFGMAAAGAAVIGYSFAGQPWQLLGFRIIHGLGGAVLVPAVFAYAGDKTASGSVGRSMSFTGAAIAFSSLIGPAFGGIGSAALGPRMVFAILGVLLCITAIVTALATDKDAVAPGHDKSFSLLSMRRKLVFVLENASLREAYSYIFTLTFAMGTLAFGLPLTMEAAGFSSARTGIYFAVYAGAAILVFLLPTNRVSDIFGRRSSALAGLILVGTALLMVSFSSSTVPVVIAMVLFGSGFSTMFTAVSAMIVDHTDEENRGTAFGIFHAVFSLGSFSGPIAAGFIVQIGTIPYWISIGIIIVTGIMYTVRYLLQRDTGGAPQ
jgi:MFS family permease